MKQEIRIEQLLGRRLLSGNNRPVGRIEEFRCERVGRGWVISALVIGRAGLVERLHMSVKSLFALPARGYVARWDQVDVSDPERPRLTCPVEDLE